ncbi:MAG: TIGR04283 family arsenosugar biosynthesis glycosyltransferase [Anaerolineae bacterium]
MLVSVIIPTFNESQNIRECVDAARRGAASDEVEIIVADGGSIDATLDVVPEDVTVVHAPTGRGVQMNRGADAARGQVFVFCHADTRLPAGWREEVLKILRDPEVSGGGFQRIFKPARGFVRVINRIKIRDNWRLLHGDRCQFMRRETFEEIGGFPEIPLMEDVEMARALHEHGKIRMVPLPKQVVSSSRRLLEQGPLRQYLLTGWYRFRYFYLGATPEDIARAYRSSREEAMDAAKPNEAPVEGTASHTQKQGKLTAIVLLAISILAPIIWPLLSRQALVDTSVIREFIQGTGAWAPLVWAILYTVVAPIPFVAPILSPVAGLLFGTIWGLPLVLLVATLSSVIPFMLARWLGRAWVERRIDGKKVEELYERSEGMDGFLFVLLLRLVPVLPWELQNYVAGVTKIGIPTFLAATALGILPGSTSLVLFGDAAADGNPWKTGVAFALDTTAIVLTPIIAGLLYRRSKREQST